jgi:hypothetical protein
MNQDESIEQEIVRKGLTAPRVTPQDIEESIASEWFFTGGDGAYGAAMGGTPHEKQPPVPIAHPLHLLTFCVLVLRNGFTVVGKSACASPENFDAELGKKIARQDAVSQVWPLMGYALKDRLANVN